MYIIQTNLSDDEVDKANGRIAEEIEKRGGSVLNRERLGKKRLAYPIAKHDDGTYHLMYFELPPGEIAGLRAAYRLHPRLLRFLILRKEHDEVPKGHKRGPARPDKAETAPEGDEKEPTGGEKEHGEASAAESKVEAEASAEPEAESAAEEASEPSKAEAEPNRQE